MGHGRRSDQTQVLVEAWVPACAGMARKGNSRIVTMFVEANWVTAAFAGMTNDLLFSLYGLWVRHSDLDFADLKGRLDVGVSGNVRHDGIRMGLESGLEFGHRVEIEMAHRDKGRP
jgi:hypothetical protein